MCGTVYTSILLRSATKRRLSLLLIDLFFALPVLLYGGLRAAWTVQRSFGCWKGELNGIHELPIIGLVAGISLVAGHVCRSRSKPPRSGPVLVGLFVSLATTFLVYVTVPTKTDSPWDWPESDEDHKLQIDLKTLMDAVTHSAEPGTAEHAVSIERKEVGKALEEGRPGEAAERFKAGEERYGDAWYELGDEDKVQDCLARIDIEVQSLAEKGRFRDARDRITYYWGKLGDEWRRRRGERLCMRIDQTAVLASIKDGELSKAARMAYHGERRYGSRWLQSNYRMCMLLGEAYRERGEPGLALRWYRRAVASSWCGNCADGMRIWKRMAMARIHAQRWNIPAAFVCYYGAIAGYGSRPPEAIYAALWTGCLCLIIAIAVCALSWWALTRRTT